MSVCVRVKWTASGHRGRRGQPATRTVVDIASVGVIVRRRRTTVANASEVASAPTIAHSNFAPVCADRPTLTYLFVITLRAKLRSVL